MITDAITAPSAGTTEVLLPLRQVLVAAPEWRLPAGALATAADVSLRAVRGALGSAGDSRLARAAADLVHAAAATAGDSDLDHAVRANALAVGAEVHRDALRVAEARAERCGRLLSALVHAVALVTGLALIARALRPAPEGA